MKPEEAGMIALLAAGIIASVWFWVAAPCGAWTFAKAGDVPARCTTK